MTPGPPATEDVFGQLAAVRVIPVIVLDDSAAAAPLHEVARVLTGQPPLSPVNAAQLAMVQPRHSA